MRIVLLCAACALFGACAAGHRWEKIELASLPPVEAAAGASHLVLLDEETVRFDIDPATGKAATENTSHERWRVTHNRDRFEVRAYYGRAMSRITDISARLIRPDGTERTYSRSDALDRMVQSEELFSDFRVLTIVMKNVPAGSVVEWQYTRIHSDPLYFGAALATRDEFPMSHALLNVEYPESWSVEVFHARGDATPEVKVTHEGGWIRRTWEARDVAAARDEANAGEWEPPSLAVRLMKWVENGEARHGFADAREMSDWTAGLYGPPPSLDPEMKRVYDKVLAGAPADPVEKTRRLYDWVKTEIQYCAVEVGLGGWKPIPPSDVLRVRYGDCKGKAELLHTLLTAAAVNSHPVLVKSHAQQAQPFNLALLNRNFNHVIDVVDLPGGRLVLDPTSQVPFGELPVSDQGADLLPVVPGGEPLMKAPVETSEDNRLEARIDTELRWTGELVGSIDLQARGSAASSLESGFRMESRGRYHKLLEQALELGKDTVEEPTFRARAAKDDTLAVQAKVHWDRAVTHGRGTARYLQVGRFFGDWLPSLPQGPRSRPVWLGSPRTRKERITMRLPPTSSVDHLPGEVRAHCDWADYRLSFHQDGGALVIERELRLERSDVPPEQYADLLAFLGQVHVAEAQAVVLEVSP